MTIRIILFAVAFLIPISAGAQTPVDCMAVYDANGTRVARTYEGVGTVVVPLDTVFSDQGRLFVLKAATDRIFGDAELLFTGDDCTGDAFITLPGWLPRAHLLADSTDGWYPDETAAPVTIIRHSEINPTHDSCSPNLVGVEIENVFPAIPFTLPTFMPPFHL